MIQNQHGGHEQPAEPIVVGGRKSAAHPYAGAEQCNGKSQKAVFAPRVVYQFTAWWIKKVSMKGRHIFLG